VRWNRTEKDREPLCRHRYGHIRYQALEPACLERAFDSFSWRGKPIRKRSGTKLLEYSKESLRYGGNHCGKCDVNYENNYQHGRSY
jgi:hypothetical protein